MTGYPDAAAATVRALAGGAEWLPAPGSGIGRAFDPRLGGPPRSVLDLAALPSAVPCARLHARAVVSEWGMPEVAGTAELLVSEIVTNAVAETTRTRGPDTGVITLRLTAGAGAVLIEVHDPSPRMPGRRLAPDDAEHGRGLMLVELLSTEWGAHPLPGRGKIVWCVAAEGLAP